MAGRQEINPSHIKGCASSSEKCDDGLPNASVQKAPSPKYVSLVDSLSSEWLKLPLVIMQDVGPAVKTLGGLLNITNRETFSPVEEIAAAISSAVQYHQETPRHAKCRGLDSQCRTRPYQARKAP